LSSRVKTELRHQKAEANGGVSVGREALTLGGVCRLDDAQTRPSGTGTYRVPHFAA